MNYRVLRFDELTVERNRGEEVARAMKATGEPNAQMLGVFLPMIGVSTNVVTAISNWTTEPAAPSRDDGRIVSVRSRLFDTLARGQNSCTADGIYTHRWFVVAPENVQALTDMSVE